MKRLSVVVLAFMIATASGHTAAGQDDLETRVSELETTVAELSGTPTAPIETAATITIYGTFAVGDIAGDSVTQDGDFCFTSGGFSDIGSGTDITVLDGSGIVIATSRLERPVTLEGQTWACVFPFIIENVPAVDFYTIEVGRRGDLTYSAAELQAADYHLDLTLGDPVFFFDYDFLTPTPIPTVTNTPLPTSTPTVTPTPGPTFTPSATPLSVERVLIESRGLITQEDPVFLVAGTWRVTVEVDPVKGAFFGAKFVAADVSFTQTTLLSQLVEGTSLQTFTAEVVLSGEPGRIVVNTSDVEDWTLTMERV